MSNKIALYFDNQSFDFRKFNDHFQLSLVKELDFQNEVVNCERARSCFRDYPHLYMPVPHIWKSSKRAIVMEFVRGHRIDDIESIKE